MTMAVKDLDQAQGATARLMNFVRRGDVLLNLVIAVVAILILLGFGWWLTGSNLLAFPDMSSKKPEPGYAEYFLQVLDYRERRLALALILRTFTTGFSFVVGLALCTQGGIFILRQVTAFTTISATGKPLDGGFRPTAPMFSFSSYSPGVVFLLGGVTLMLVTQWTAIAVTAPEIAPASALQLCTVEGKDTWLDCRAVFRSAAATGNPVAATTSSDPCKSDPTLAYCKARSEGTK